MFSIDSIRELFAYNYWARDRQLEACRALTPLQFVRPLDGSFPTIRDTLAHLVDGKVCAWHRWQGHSRDEIIAAMGCSRVEERKSQWAEQFPNLEAVEVRGQEVEERVRRFLSSLTSEAMERRITSVDSTSRTWEYPLWQLLSHHINNQTYHRGQVTTQFRQLGARAAAIDLLRYYEAETAG